MKVNYIQSLLFYLYYNFYKKSNIPDKKPTLVELALIHLVEFNGVFGLSIELTDCCDKLDLQGKNN